MVVFVFIYRFLCGPASNPHSGVQVFGKEPVFLFMGFVMWVYFVYGFFVEPALRRQVFRNERGNLGAGLIEGFSCFVFI